MQKKDRQGRMNARLQQDVPAGAEEVGGPAGGKEGEGGRKGVKTLMTCSWWELFVTWLPCERGSDSRTVDDVC